MANKFLDDLDGILNTLNSITINGRISKDADYTRRFKEDLKQRNHYYTNLLSYYITMSEERNSRKEFHKWFFFWAIIFHILVIDVAILLVFIKVFLSDDTNLWNLAPAIFSAVTAFVSTVIAIPITVTKYLFNVDEDNNMTKIISHTQDYDGSGHQILLSKLLDDQKRPPDDDSSS